MKALLDTQSFLWAVSEPGRLGPLDELVEDPATELLVSAVVPWEIAIKSGKGRLALETELPFFLRHAVASIEAIHLPITHEHAVAVETLPPIHRDPFDRLLVAQARTLGAPIITADRRIARYDVEVLSPN